MITVRPAVEGAKGWQLGAMREWRVATGDAVETTNAEPRDGDGDGYIYDGTDREQYVGKHAVHDQLDHGNWARGGGMSVEAQEAAMRWAGNWDASWDLLAHYGKVLDEASSRRGPWRDSEARQDAMALTSALREAPAEKKAVYRGVQRDPEWEAGDVVELPLAAVSYSQDIALSYSHDFEPGRSPGTYIVVRPGAPVIDLQELGGRQYQEAITGGRFKVVERDFGTSFQGANYPWYELEFIEALPPLEPAQEVVDGDGDGKVFDGTDKERPA